MRRYLVVFFIFSLFFKVNGFPLGGCCLDFDNNDDYVNIGSNQVLYQTGSVTVAAWVKLRDNSIASHIFSSWHGGQWSGYNLLASYYPEGYPVFYVGHSNALNQNIGVRSDIYIGDNQWHHIAGVFDANAQIAAIYIDGVKRNEESTNFNTLGYPNNQCSTMTIGLDCSSPNGSYYDFNGMIDEVVVYSRALSDEEIYNLYQMGVSGQEISPDMTVIGLWHFNEGTGQTAFDSSSYNNDGILGSSSSPDSSDPTWYCATVTPSPTPTLTPTPAPLPSLNSISIFLIIILISLLLVYSLNLESR